MKTDSFFNNEFNLPSIVRGDVRIDWVNLKEGRDGDYDPSDPTDTNLLRFDAYKMTNGEWVEVEDSSYCTQVPANTNEEILRRILVTFMDFIYDEVVGYGKAKRKCELLSWTAA